MGYQEALRNFNIEPTKEWVKELGTESYKKVKVPQEVAIVSFDELSAFDLVDPPITSIIQPVTDIGNLALEILMKKIEGNAPKTSNKRVLDVKLEVRKSCGTI